jgi:hypothetical protein
MNQRNKLIYDLIKKQLKEKGSIPLSDEKTAKKLLFILETQNIDIETYGKIMYETWKDAVDILISNGFITDQFKFLWKSFTKGQNANV